MRTRATATAPSQSSRASAPSSPDVADVTLTIEAIGPEPAPMDLSWRRLRKQLLVVAAVIAAVVAGVLLVPGLGELRDHFAGAELQWIGLAAVLQIGSCLSYVLAFRTVFCRRMSWVTSYEIGVSALAANSLLSVGGGGGAALGGGVPGSGGRAG